MSIQVIALLPYVGAVASVLAAIAAVVQTVRASRLRRIVATHPSNDGHTSDPKGRPFEAATEHGEHSDHADLLVPRPGPPSPRSVLDDLAALAEQLAAERSVASVAVQPSVAIVDVSSERTSPGSSLVLYERETQLIAIRALMQQAEILRELGEQDRAMNVLRQVLERAR